MSAENRRPSFRVWRSPPHAGWERPGSQSTDVVALAGPSTCAEGVPVRKYRRQYPGAQKCAQHAAISAG